LHNEELHNFDASTNIVRVIKSWTMRWVERVAWMGKMRNVYSILVGRPETKTQLGRSTRRRKDNIRMDIMKVGWEGLEWIHLAQDRDHWRALVNTVMNFRVP
jgi:hypothetical protein